MHVAKRRSKEFHERKRLLSEGYTECVSCGSLIKPGSRRCAECGALKPSTKRALVALTVASVLVVASVAIYVYYPREEYVVLPSVVEFAPSGYGATPSIRITATFNKPMDRTSVEASFRMIPSVQGSFAWSGTTMTFSPSSLLGDQTYYTVTVGQGSKDLEGLSLDCSVFTWSFFTGSPPTERRDVGTGADDFWTTYPPMHPLSGGTVQHPAWVLSALESGTVMILDHSEGCLPCIQQTSICEAVYSAYPGIHYFDLSSGTDEPQASEAFAAYDPNGAVHYVPLTVVVTNVHLTSGETVIGWHSWEGVIDQSSLSSWIADAMSHWEES